MAFLIISPLGTTAFADWGVSIVIANQGSEYKGGIQKLSVIPDIAYRENSPKKGNNLIAYDLVITSKNTGFESNDNTIFSGMKTRKESLDIGFQAIVETQLVPLKFELSNDLVASKSYQASMKIGGVSSMDSSDRSFHLRPYVGVRFQSSKVIDYHYGVSDSEQTANRKSYKGASATTSFLGLEAVTNLTQDITINASIDYEKRAKSIRNSPLTDDKKYDAKASLGLVYWF